MEWLTLFSILGVGMAIVSTQNSISNQLSRIEDLLQNNDHQNEQILSALHDISGDVYGLRKKTPDRIKFDPIDCTEELLE